MVVPARCKSWDWAKVGRMVVVEERRKREVKKNVRRSWTRLRNMLSGMFWDHSRRGRRRTVGEEENQEC